MKIDLNQQLQNGEGEPYKEGDLIITVRRVCRQALLAPEERLTLAEHTKRWDLFESLKGDPDLNVDEVAYLIKQVTRAYDTPLVVGQVNALLNA